MPDDKEINNVNKNEDPLNPAPVQGEQPVNGENNGAGQNVQQNNGQRVFTEEELKRIEADNERMIQVFEKLKRDLKAIDDEEAAEKEARRLRKAERRKAKDKAQNTEEKKEDSKGKNFFDMEGDDLGQIVKQDNLKSAQRREKLSTMSKKLDSIFGDDEDEAEKEQAPIENKPKAEDAPAVEEEDIFAELREAVKNKEHEKPRPSAEDNNQSSMPDDMLNKMAGAFALDMEGELIPDDQLNIAQEVLVKVDQPEVDNDDIQVEDADDIVIEDITDNQKEVAEDAIPLEEVAVGGENDPNAIENIYNPKLRIPDFFVQLGRRLDNQTVANQVKNEMSDILKAAGITDPTKLSETVGYAYVYGVDAIRSVYDPEGVRLESRDIMGYVFDETHTSLGDIGLSSKDYVITTQKLVDVVLKNYSPVTFANGALDRYADKYIISSRTLLKERLEALKYPENEIDTLVEEIREALKPAPEKEQAVKENVEQVQETVPEAVNDPNAVKVEEKVEPDVDLTKELPRVNNDKKSESPAEKIDDSAKVAVFMEKIAEFGKMYKVDIKANNFAFYTGDAWKMLKSGDEQKKVQGQKILASLMRNTLTPAFDAERKLSYNEHRLPDYAEITKSANELLRSAMFAFTDLYHNPDSTSLFDATAFGGLNEKDIAKLTQGDSLWKMDQKSDEAWELQSKEAKSIADKWLAGDKPYEKMINEMKAIVSEDKKGIVSRKEVLDKLTAAEWLLVNDGRMMVADPDDPLNPIPNWGNRYWKAIAEARESLGIDKHTSMRDLIQADYAASAKAVNSVAYNKAQIKDYVLDPGAREVYDSMELQKEQFATQSAHVTLTEPQVEKKTDEIEMTADRVQISIQILDQREIMKNEPKNYNFVIERTAELTISAQNQGPQA